MSKRWHIVSCFAQKEKQALSHISEGFDCYLPSIIIGKVKRNRTRYVSERLLFPGYMFIELPEKIPDLRRWREYGVECLLTWPKGIPDGAIWAIARAEREMNQKAKTLLGDVQAHVQGNGKATARLMKRTRYQDRQLLTTKDTRQAWIWLERELISAGPEHGLGVLMSLLSQPLILPQGLASQYAA